MLCFPTSDPPGWLIEGDRMVEGLCGGGGGGGVEGRILVKGAEV